MFEEPSARRLAHIGGVCMQWAYLEGLLSAIIWRQLNLEYAIGKIVTGGLDMLPRINMAINLGNELKTDRRVIEALKQARKEIQDKLIERRNKVVHGQHWLIAGQTPAVEVHRGKGNRTPEAFSDKEIYELVEAIALVSKNLGEALFESKFIERVNLSEIEKQATSMFRAS